MKSGVLEHTVPGDPAVPGAKPVPGYRLVRRLGAGGFGEVWSAEGPGGFLVALKIIRFEGARSSTHLRGLEIARTVRHPNLLAGFGAWADDERMVLAMELADGSLWDRFLEARGLGLAGIAREELIEALGEAAKGVDYLNAPRHEAGDRAGLGIQHRDLKPQNILLVGGGVKVADFGAARWMEESVTAHTGLQWTPAYAAPEFFLGATSRHSDQYSLAVTYCHLRAGRLPFTGDPASVMAGHLMREPDLSSLDGAERPAVARALAKQPEDRWPSCRAFVEGLRAGDPAARRGASPGPVARACLVWPSHVPISLAEATPSPAHDPTPDDADDSLWDDSGYGTPDLADESTTDVAPFDAPTADSFAPAPVVGEVVDRDDFRPAPTRRRRHAMAVASSLIAGGLALGTIGLVRWTSPARRPIRARHPSTLALHSPSPSPPMVRPEPPEDVAGPDLSTPPLPDGSGQDRPAPPTLLVPAAAREDRPARPDPDPDGSGVLRRVALRPVGPSAPAERATGAGRALARLMVPLFVNPTVRGVAVKVADPSPIVDAGPPPAEAARRRGEEHLGRGELDAAIAGYTEAIRLDPGLAGAFEARGQVFLKRGDPARAIADLDEALRLHPDSAPARNDRGLAALALGDVLRAIADLDAALGVAPGSAVIHYNRGVAYSRLGDPVEALAEFDAALRIDPGLAVARTARGQVPARQVVLSRAGPRSSRPASASPPRPVPTGLGVTPTSQDTRPTDAPPGPPVPAAVAR